ncbi:unnamed protein product [Chondrus crispus]|uniref:PKD/REJ-like domain-containing protein n=1 Tax=Chondrus crispus TaxID=2769 RepID=R7QPQ0_CHOCR|nr:unnamed protein product [Chondrus crispus]CDF39370.1 unnamed protein product [Chondrus crispus]|eukprot:XP_005719281.1 unnamed protein product [Chondrus crispus]
MSDAVECDSTLLADGNIDAKEFTVSSESWASIQNTSSRVHIQYGLQVSKTSVNATDDEIERVSDDVQSTLILAQEAEQSYESLQGIVVLNNQSVLLDKTSVKYYEDVIITPESATEETTWKFELLSPLSQTFTLLASDSNLLDLPGYFGARDEPGRLSLGLKANVLTPNTQYEFLVSSFRTGFSVNEQKISLTTVEKPRIILGNYATPTGTTEDTYVLSAYASYDGDFKFFFMLKDDFGFEMCVGGCQGENVVQFRLGTAGTYAVRCDVYDSLGYTLLANATGGSIVVSEELTITDLSQFGEQAEQAFLAGDHAIYQQLGADMVKHVVSLGESQSPDLDSEILANFTLGMNQVAANAVPNPIQSAGYVRMAASLASLTPDLGITFDTETLYYLVNITVSAIDRVPDNGALQVLEELLDFYDLTPELVLETYSQGTSRRRLLHEMQDSGKEVREIWLDIYEVLKNQVVLTVLKRCTCGCVEEVQTGVSSPSRISLNLRRAMMRQARNQSAIESYVNPIQGRLSPVSIKLAHFCNSEQGNQLKVDEDTVDEVRFSWCKGIFENSIKKLYFALAKTPDYIYLSQLRKNVTLSNGLVTTVIAELNGNAVEDATLPISNCYTVEMPMLRNFSDTGTSIPEEEQPRGIRLHPPKQWQEPASLALYNPIFSGLTTTVGDTASTSETEYITATVKMSSTGVLAVGTRIHWSGGLFSLEGIFLSAAEIAGVTVVIFVLVLGATISTWVVATKLIGQTGPLPPVEADFTYVERDVYGRGTALDIMEDER